MEFKEIGKNVYACLLEDKGWGFNNSGFISSGDGLIVDTHYDLTTTQQQKDHIMSVMGKLPRYLVNTHHNGDHVYGNQLYADLEIIAHRKCAEEMQAEKDANLVQLFAGLQAGGPEAIPPGLRWFFDDVQEFDFQGIDMTIPNRLIDDRLELDLGGTPCEIIYAGPAHTSNDLIVHLPAQGIVFVSDIMFWKCTPIGWAGSHEQWLKAIDMIISFKPGIIVPGHGPLCGVNELLEFKGYLEYVYGESKRLYDQGVTEPLEAAKQIDISKYREWTQPERVVWTVARAFRDFRGESWDTLFGDALSLMDLGHQLREYWNT